MTTPNFTADPDPATRGESHQGIFRIISPLPHLVSCADYPRLRASRRSARPLWMRVDADISTSLAQ